MQGGQIIRSVLRFLADEGIEFAAAIPYAECRTVKARLLEFAPRTAIMLLAPYYSGQREGNISLYAAPRDYHIYFSGLFERLYAGLGNRGCIMKGYADHSPIAEVEAAAKAGLGIVGENGLLINRRYGSYVFIGELLTDLPCDDRGEYEIKRCSGCGLCSMSCPSPAECMSAITQKKGELSDDQRALIRRCGCAWGCDICQTVCPHNRNIAETPLAYFREDILPALTPEELDAMSDADFAARAYSWRGRATIARNLAIIAGCEKNK